MPTKSKTSSSGSISERVAALMRPIAEECGVQLWDIVFEKEGSAWFLRITIDKIGGLDMDTCERFTKLANPILDEADPIEQSYYLEIGSPGLGRRLRTEAHYAASVGQKIHLRTIRPVDGKRDFYGTLTAYHEKTVLMNTEEGERRFAAGDISFTKYDDDQF